MPLVSLIFVYWNLLSIGVLVFWLLCISGDVVCLSSSTERIFVAGFLFRLYNIVVESVVVQ